MLKILVPFAISLAFVGCASVPKVNQSQAQNIKKLNVPAEGQAAIYVYRSNNIIGSALKKDIWIDGECLGESARGVFFYKEVKGGEKHTVSTESEFSPNHLEFQADTGKQYFIQQYIKPGVIVGGAGLKLVDDVQGKKAITEYDLAQSGKCSKASIEIKAKN